MHQVETISADILNTFPAVDLQAIEQQLRAEVKHNRQKLVVLDDDPTGVQTVHGVSVYTNWSEDSIEQGFAEENKLFYILTNSRGLTAEQTQGIHREIAGTVCRVSRRTGKDFMILSRSDSTLRGHYPLETELLKEVVETETGITIDGEILCPFFKEGGRFTIDNIHYVKYDQRLVPAGETEFASDRTFGYRSSDLRDYVEEKTGGQYRADQTTCIDLQDLRSVNLPKIEQQLQNVHGFNKVIVNAIDYVDIKVFCIALYHVIARGKHFMFRTAAALVKELGGISDQPLLTRKQLIQNSSQNGGVIVVGSHTRKTTEQLEELKTLDQVACVEFDSDLVLNDCAFKQETERAAQAMDDILKQGKTAVVYTRRRLLVVEQDTKEEALARSAKISEVLQSLVSSLKMAPSFIIAKGGITSSDIGTKALAVQRANVMGQICPGIPVWQTGTESRFPGIPYVIFPGNVGERGTLKEAANILIEKV